eukprot:3819274-Rhodomonas_salina.1
MKNNNFFAIERNRTQKSNAGHRSPGPDRAMRNQSNSSSEQRAIKAVANAIDPGSRRDFAAHGISPE